MVDDNCKSCGVGPLEGHLDRCEFLPWNSKPRMLRDAMALKPKAKKMIDERTADHIMRALGAIENNGGSLKVTHTPQPVAGQDSMIIITEIDVAVQPPPMTTHAVGELSITGPSNRIEAIAPSPSLDGDDEATNPVRWEVNEGLIFHFEQTNEAGDMNIAIVSHDPSKPNITDFDLSVSSRIRMARELIRGTDFIVAPNSAV